MTMRMTTLPASAAGTKLLPMRLACPLAFEQARTPGVLLASATQLRKLARVPVRSSRLQKLARVPVRSSRLQKLPPVPVRSSRLQKLARVPVRSLRLLTSTA